jgi:malonyl-CoA/methylmalonyl-CoA synthetase
MLPIFKRIDSNGTPTKYNKDAVAIINYNENGDKEKEFSYGELHRASQNFAVQLLKLSCTDDLREQRVAFLIDPPGFEYVMVQWAIWKAGGVAVPLARTHPLPSLLYVLNDSGSSILVVSSLSSVAQKLLISNQQREDTKLLVVVLNDKKEKEDEVGVSDSAQLLPDVHPTRRAMILYTSGTTSLPKGVVTTHANIEAQITTLVQSWQWSTQDHTLCVLPLHHIHGIVNVVGCALWAGATCSFLPSFSAGKVFHLFRTAQPSITVFMAVPTIYHKLIAYYENQCSEPVQQDITQSLRSFRLMVCGSAALPVTIMEKWEIISGGQRLLERYGMTEIGMALSNPYCNGERRPGFVGLPLPGVTLRLVDDDGQDVVPTTAGLAGEILVRGNNVFLEYWNRPKETWEAFTLDGHWFRTGDVAIIEDGYYRILGRKSVDIIKSGGYKLSALEIEEVIRTYGSIQDVAVVGIPDEEWGELVVAMIVISTTHDSNKDDTIFNVDHLTNWLREQMPSYKIPRKYHIAKELPRNAMGKVVKNDVKKVFVKEYAANQ